jgi:hypothetical protein
LNDSSITNQNLGENISFKETPSRDAFHYLISNSHYFLYLDMFYASHVQIVIPDPIANPSRVLCPGSYFNEEPTVNDLYFGNEKDEMVALESFQYLPSQPFRWENVMDTCESMYFIDSCIIMDVKDERPYRCHEQLIDTIIFTYTFPIWVDHFNVVQLDYHDPSQTPG